MVMVKVKAKKPRLENEGGLKSRRNEQVARIEVECQSGGYMHDDCLATSMISANGGEGLSPPLLLSLSIIGIMSTLSYGGLGV